MFSDVSDQQKARANLILISAAVILYIHGGGHFERSNFLGGSITFSNKEALPTAGILFFIFIVWRFLLSSGDAIKEFAWDFNKYVYSSPEYDKVLNDWFGISDIGEGLVAGVLTSNIFKRAVGGTHPFPPRINNILFPISLAYNRVRSMSGVAESKPYFPKINDNELITNYVGFYNFRLLVDLIIRSFIKAIFFRRGFTDVVFPFLIGYYATIILTYRISDKLNWPW